MSLESASDRQEYVNTFGVITYIDDVKVMGIYDAPHLESLGVSTSVPQLLVAAENLADSVTAGTSTVEVPSAEFEGIVTDIQRDGTGMVLLFLRSSS